MQLILLGFVEHLRETETHVCVVDEANALNPPPRLSAPLPKGNPDAGSPNPATVHLMQYDASKCARIFGIKYRTITETTRDILTDFEARGW